MLPCWWRVLVYKHSQIERRLLLGTNWPNCHVTSLFSTSFAFCSPSLADLHSQHRIHIHSVFIELWWSCDLGGEGRSGAGLHIGILYLLWYYSIRLFDSDFIEWLTLDESALSDVRSIVTWYTPESDFTIIFDYQTTYQQDNATGNYPNIIHFKRNYRNTEYPHFNYLNIIGWNNSEYPHFERSRTTSRYSKLFIEKRLN